MALVYPAQARENQQIGQLSLDLTKDRSNGEDIPISGEWVVVDVGATGAVRANFHTRLSDDDSTLLIPGRVYRRSFRSVRIYNTAVASGGNFGGITATAPNNTFRIFYGSGPVPFENAPTNGSGISLQYTFGTSTAANMFYYWNVTEGMKVDVYASVQQFVTIGSTSKLRSAINLIDVNNIVWATLQPDNQTIDDAPVAASIGVARSRYTWRNIIIPRGITTLSVITQNNGNEVANGIGLDTTALISH